MIYHNPGKRLLTLPGLGRMDVRSMGGAAVIPWYLSGGIAAANCVAAYLAKGAASLAASYVNLANPGTNDLTTSSAPTFATATGWTFSGSGPYLATGVIPTNSYSMIVRFSDFTAADYKVVCGMRNIAGYGYFMIGPRWDNATVAILVNTSFQVQPTPASSGVWAICGASAYIDGASAGGTGTPYWTNGLEIFIGGANVAGENSWRAAVKVQALAIYNTTITAPQVAAVSTAMAAL